jgi:hypothetical protein
MAVDVSQFDSVEDLDVYFKKQKAKAPDEDAERAVDSARLEARAEFFEFRATRASLEVAKRDALDKYPLAKEFADMVNGRTPEEITNAAKTVHERLEVKLQTTEKAEADRKAAEEATKAAAKASYGTPAAAGGGQPAPNRNSQEEMEAEVHKRLSDGRGLQDSGSKLLVARWQSGRVADAVNAAITNPSYRSGFRRGEPGDTKVTDDRTRRKG